MQKLSTEELENTANQIRQEIIKMLNRAGSGHAAGSLGVVEIITALYFQIMNHDPKEPLWEDRDRFILSNGHVCPARYAAMALAGYFPLSELKSLRQLESRLQGHPERTRFPALETTSGPLGSGLAQAAGYAQAAKMDEKRFRVFCLTSDGEQDCGNHWEAVLFAAKYKLANLTCFLDRNQIQIGGSTEEVLPLEPLKEKYKAFNWHVLEIDGHDFEKIITAVAQARAYYQGPTMIICRTTPGKGVSFMENDFTWHGKAPNKEEAEKALIELRKYA